MWTWLSVAMVLAQAGDNAPAAAPNGAQPGAQPGAGSMFGFFGPILLAFVVMMWMNSRQTRKEQSRRRDMISNLKKNDQVTTIGGIIGTFVSRSEDGTEITLRMVDDTRIKFRADAIRDVLVTTPATTDK